MTAPFTPRWKAVLDKHRRHVELSPGAGKDAQNYALAVIADIEADFVHDSPRSEIERPKDFDAALERIDAACREVQILCDEFGIDPYEYLADDEPQSPPTETRQSILEEAAKVCDAYVGGICEDEGNGGVSHDAAARSLAQQIRGLK